MSADLFIIAAGKGSRMGGNVPKALVPITDIPNLTTTLQQVKGKFRKIFVIINELIEDQWANYIKDTNEKVPGLLDGTINFIPITSGLGDGHAVMKAFEATCLQEKLSEDVVVCWGDVFFPCSEIMDELLKHRYAGDISGFIPAVRKASPYVTLLTDEKMQCASADFSKYGESHPAGFHDQSVFRFKKSTLWTALSTLHCCFWKNGRYMTPGGELSLLHAFHYLYNIESPVIVYETDYPTLSFNTQAEVASIQQEISNKWKSHQF